jgi:hypothetical protein
MVKPNGDVTFTPATGFAGQVPPISYMVKSSDGQVNPSVLDITVLPGMHGALPAVGAWQGITRRPGSEVHGIAILLQNIPRGPELYWPRCVAVPHTGVGTGVA